MEKIKRKVMPLTSVFTVLIAFFVSPIVSLAASVSYDKVADYVSTWHIKSLGGLHWTDDGVYMIKADGEPAFCIEHGILLNPGSGFDPSELTIPEKETLALIAYYGYQMNKTNENYGITQNLIWQSLGDELLSTNIPNFKERSAEILSQVKKFGVKPSFHNQTVELKVGESITLTDTNNVLENYTHLFNNTANVKVDKQGNQLKITATKDSNEAGQLSYGIANNESVGQSFVYSKPDEQKIATFKLDNAGEMNLNIKVNLNGNVKLKKVDEETGLPVPDTKMKFEYDGQEKEVITNKNGIAQLDDLRAGAKVKITEVTASNGFVNKGEIKEVTIEPNQTIEVIFGNKAQQGLLHLKKTGQVAKTVVKEDSDYGLVHKLVFDYLPLADVKFIIKAREDIKVGDHLYAEKGATVATVKTDEHGELINMPQLYLGKYEAIEVEAPAGFTMNQTPIPFEFVYGGEDVELVSQSLEISNDFQKVSVVVHKNEEKLSNWEENKPVIENVDSNDKVFGLFTNQEFVLSDNSILPTNALLDFGTVQKGKLAFAEQHLMEGSYYVQELDAGDSHDIDLTHHEFEFTAEDNESEKVINIYSEKENSDDEPLPLLNKLHFNQLIVAKVNEEANLEEGEGYEYIFSGSGFGAVFTLETEEKEVIQTVKIDEDSKGVFKNIPVGTFYLKEKQPSSDKYIASSEIYKVVSTLTGIQVYDSQDVLILETTSEIEQENNGEKQPELSLEIKNHLIKGAIELIKTDVVTKKELPDAGIRLMDENKKIVMEEKTNNQGKIHFDKLPKGTYYIQEFNAPVGYQVDTTPIKVEIKETDEVVKVEISNKRLSESTVDLPKTGEKNTFLMSIVGILIIVSIVGFFFLKRKNNQ